MIVYIVIVYMVYGILYVWIETASIGSPVITINPCVPRARSSLQYCTQCEYLEFVAVLFVAIQTINFAKRAQYGLGMR